MAAMSRTASISPPAGEPSIGDYRALAELRYQIRRFLSFSEHAARAAGMEPQQHQLLLAIKGLPPDRRPTIKALAERLCVQHHTVVALVDQVEARKLVRRKRNAADRREILLMLTPQGERILRGLSVQHRDQLRIVGPTLVEALAPIVGRHQEQAQARPPAAPLEPEPVVAST
jgi:DNA-binding MarR family transcriptional regulator